MTDIINLTVQHNAVFVSAQILINWLYWIYFHEHNLEVDF